MHLFTYHLHNNLKLSFTSRLNDFDDRQRRGTSRDTIICILVEETYASLSISSYITWYKCIELEKQIYPVSFKCEFRPAVLIICLFRLGAARLLDKMDVEQGATLALQILALGSIVAALLIYLIRQSRNTDEEYEIRSKRHVLVTSCDTCIGLQIALALAEAGYKVINDRALLVNLSIMHS